MKLKGKMSKTFQRQLLNTGSASSTGSCKRQKPGTALFAHVHCNTEAESLKRDFELHTIPTAHPCCYPIATPRCMSSGFPKREMFQKSHQSIENYVSCKEEFSELLFRNFLGIFNRVKLDGVFQALSSHGAGFLSPSTQKET